MKKYFLFAFTMLCTLNAFSQNALTDSLIAYYPFNGNANDASGNGLNGTVYGATLTTDRFGNAYSAYYFDGVSDYIRYAPNPKLQPTTFPYSITAWIKASVTGPNNATTIFANNLSPFVYAGIYFQISYANGGFLNITIGNGGAPNPASRNGKGGTIAVNDNQWHFVAAVVRGYSDMDLYVDCGYDAAATYSGTGSSIFYNADSAATTGMHYYNNTQYFYQGSIDELRFYHRALTQTDLQAIYSYPKPFNGLSVSLGADTSICGSNSITLTPNVTGTPLSYQWSTNSTATTISVNQAGNYAVTVYDGCGFASDTTTVLNGGNFQAGTISALRDTICAGTPGSLSLSGNSSNIIQWQSSPNDTDFTTIPGATNTSYKTPPLQQSTWYRAAVGSGVCTALSDTLELYVPTVLIAYINYTQTGAKTFKFNSDSSIGYISRYDWDFGDGSGSDSANPTHTFAGDPPYYVCLTLYDGSNCSYTFCGYIDLMMGVENISTVNSIRLYPNPVSEQLTVSSEQLTITELEIMDLLGRTIITETIHEPKQFTINVSSLTAGIYFVKTQLSDGSVQVRKFVKE